LPNESRAVRDVLLEEESLDFQDGENRQSNEGERRMAGTRDVCNRVFEEVVFPS